MSVKSSSAEHVLLASGLVYTANPSTRFRVIESRAERVYNLSRALFVSTFCIIYDRYIYRVFNKYYYFNSKLCCLCIIIITLVPRGIH